MNSFKGFKKSLWLFAPCFGSRNHKVSPSSTCGNISKYSQNPFKINETSFLVLSLHIRSTPKGLSQP